MSYLYILSEDDNDDLFYLGCVEKLLGKTFQLLPYRLRKGGGIREVRRNVRLLLQQINRIGYVEDTYFVIALDNDRSPTHPKHQQPDGLTGKDTRKK